MKIEERFTRKTKNPHTILIADRNPHVREFLRREMAAEGYRIRLAENAREVLKWCYDPGPLDLLILDPDLPDVDAHTLFARLADRIPELPLVIHSFSSNEALPAEPGRNIAFVEKRGNSIDHLKEIVGEMLSDPDRIFAHETGNQNEAEHK